ncbi:cation-translocating P-type ATPase [Verrucomicrobiota bacterium sgz303538]
MTADREPSTRLRHHEPWHCQEPEEALSRVSASHSGLDETEVARRQTEHGPNELKQAERTTPWKLLLAQFKSLIIWILIVAGVVSGILGEVADAVAILAIVVLNALIGFYQEYNAEKSIAALRKMTAPQAKVRRNGQTRIVPASQIVPGDILELEAGDLVSADARLLRAASLKCIESALTGESEAVSKKPAVLPDPELPLGDRINMVFMGTSVAEGTGEAVVVATGMETELGKIAGLLEHAKDETTPLQKNLEYFGRILVWASLAIVVTLFVLGILRGMDRFELFMTSVSLAVAAVPEGLPAVVTIALALGVMRMSRRRALVRKLAAVETLGSTNVICTDKTGTLTVGEMTVRQLWTAGRSFDVHGHGYAPDGEVHENDTKLSASLEPVLEALAINLVGCNNAHLIREDDTWKVIGDPTEGAMLAAGAKLGMTAEKLEAELPKVHEIPFDSDRKRRTVIRTMSSGSFRALTNGAPDVLLERCTHILSSEGARPITESDRQQIIQENAAMAERALRVLGCGYRELAAFTPHDLDKSEADSNLIFVGLAGMYDPPRPEAKEAVSKCRSAGIRVVMITGDHPRTALAIARELGIAQPEDEALSGVEIERLSQEALQEHAPHAAVYARVTAEHKLRIVRAWQARGATVAMTGDGVNDAPAIKGADIGVAMGRTGTEVTKQAADIIVTDDNFASIVAAVEEGRGIYANIRKTLEYLLSGNCGELLLMAAAIIIGLPAPLLAIHLLWINLVTDGLPALCLASDPIDPDVMNREPRGKHERITSGRFLPMMLLAGVLDASVAFGVYVYKLSHTSVEEARTFAFAALVFVELLRSFSYRSDRKPIWQISPFSNVQLALVALVSFVIQVISQHSETLARFLRTSLVPLRDCLVLLAISTLPLIVLELVKVVRIRNKKTR